MEAVIIAGGTPVDGDPLFEYTQGKPKALLDIAGRPMAQWVMDALSSAEEVHNIVAIGLPKDEALHSDKPIIILPNQGGLLENVRAGLHKVLEKNPEADRTLLASSDIPTITSEMVDWVIKTAQETEHDIYYNVVAKEVMEKRFPGSNRSFIRFRDMAVCGGDMNVIRTSLVKGNDELWQRIVDARKSALKQAALLGVDTLFLMLLRIVSLEGAQKRVSKRLGLRGRAVLCPYAEIAMDVDKPHQLQILREDLSRRTTS